MGGRKSIEWLGPKAGELALGVTFSLGGGELTVIVRRISMCAGVAFLKLVGDVIRRK